MRKLNEIILIACWTLSCRCSAESSKPPCEYFRSENITGAVITDSGSAIFNGKEYRNGSYGYFNNSFFERVDQADVNKTHLRGCFCDLPGKPCVSFCCPPGYIKRDSRRSSCFPYNQDLYIETSNIEKNITTINVIDKYRIVQRDPCRRYSTDTDDKWKLLEVYIELSF